MSINKVHKQGLSTTFETLTNVFYKKTQGLLKYSYVANCVQVFPSFSDISDCSKAAFNKSPISAK